jgi:hypothetical protein
VERARNLAAAAAREIATFAPRDIESYGAWEFWLDSEEAEVLEHLSNPERVRVHNAFVGAWQGEIR